MSSGWPQLPRPAYLLCGRVFSTISSPSKFVFIVFVGTEFVLFLSNFESFRQSTARGGKERPKSGDSAGTTSTDLNKLRNVFNELKLNQLILIKSDTYG